MEYCKKCFDISFSSMSDKTLTSMTLTGQICFKVLLCFNKEDLCLWMKMIEGGICACETDFFYRFLFKNNIF